MVAHARYRRPVEALASRLPADVREMIEAQVQTLVRELDGARTPRQVRRRLAVPQVRARLVDPLAPALDRLCGLVAWSSLPVSPALGHTLVTASSLVGSTLDSGLEALGLACVEVPPAAGSIFAAAGAVGLLTELVEFWVLASCAVSELRAEPGGGRSANLDRAQLRDILVRTYLGPRSLGGGSLDGLWRPVAQVVLRRVATRWVPLLGIPASVALANRDLVQARRFARQRRPNLPVGQLLSPSAPGPAPIAP